MGNREQPAAKTNLRQEQDSTDSTSELGNGRWECAECIGYSEIDKYASSVYEKQFKTDKTTEEIKADLDSIKTILSDENYGILEVCYVNTAESELTSIKTTNQSVKSVLEDTSLNGDSKIRRLINSTKESLEVCSDNECLICTEMSVSAVEKQSQSSSHLNTEMAMDTSTEKNMELAICINSPSKFTTQKNTKSYATTVITQRGDTAYAHINRKKPIRNFGDITKINAKELPDFDLLVGGFPCQAFSIAGKRAGFNDTRGTLFFDIARVLKEKRPRNLVLENVKGLLSHDTGKTFQTILGVLADLGYFVEWQVLNSKDFGVPQNRERVFIVGHLGGEPRRKVFPITGTNETHFRGAKAFAYHNKRRIATTTPYSNSLSASFRGHPDGDGRPGIMQLNQPTHSNDRVYSESGVSPTLNSMQGGNRQPFVAPVLTPDRPKKRQNGRRIKNDGEPSFTLTGQDKHGLYDGARIRRLTPLECERLQGFPDNWTEGLSDTQRYKTLGNAVTVNVVEAVISSLIDTLNTEVIDISTQEGCDRLNELTKKRFYE